MNKVKLWQIAHARTGDKGDTANVSLIPYNEKDYEMLREKVTPQMIKTHFKDIVQGKVTRYELPEIHAFNFVMEGALCGGVTASLALDTHGKTLSSLLLEITIEI